MRAPIGSKRTAPVLFEGSPHVVFRFGIDFLSRLIIPREALRTRCAERGFGGKSLVPRWIGKFWRRVTDGAEGVAGYGGIRYRAIRGENPRGLIDWVATFKKRASESPARTSAQRA